MDFWFYIAIGFSIAVLASVLIVKRNGRGRAPWTVVVAAGAMCLAWIYRPRASEVETRYLGPGDIEAHAWKVTTW